MICYAKLGLNDWRQVIEHDSSGCTQDSQPLSFEAIWKSKNRSESGSHFDWSDLMVPLPEVSPHAFTDSDFAPGIFASEYSSKLNVKALSY
jgi:hypothetical protein